MSLPSSPWKSMSDQDVEPSLPIHWLMPQTRKYSSSLITNGIRKFLRHTVVSLHRLYSKWLSNTSSSISTISKELLEDLNKGGRMLTWHCHCNIHIHIMKVTTFRQLDTSSCWNCMSFYRVSIGVALLKKKDFCTCCCKECGEIEFCCCLMAQKKPGIRNSWAVTLTL